MTRTVPKPQVGLSAWLDGQREQPRCQTRRMPSNASPAPLQTLGVWYFTDAMSAPEAATFAQRVESLGYSTLWLPETTGRDPFAHIAFLSTQTSSLRFATGIAN